MPRANRIVCPGHVWHITHRCHQREFLLKFLRDRRRWRHWLFEARKRYGLSVLNYIATSNHIHLLCADRGNDEIPRSLQLIEGRVAQEFNFRKKRRGAFWEDRYHATAVQPDGHLARCFTYIDLNMVRAHAVEHPREWEVSGYHEIQHPPQRRRIIDFPVLMRLLSVDTSKELAAMQEHWILTGIANSRRISAWTESIAVGDERYLQQLRIDLGIRGVNRKISIESGYRTLNESHPVYRPVLSTKSRHLA
jgi:putative transposase